MCKSDFSHPLAGVWCVTVCDGIEEGVAGFLMIHLTDYLNPAHLSAHVKQMGSLLKPWESRG